MTWLNNITLSGTVQTTSRAANTGVFRKTKRMDLNPHKGTQWIHLEKIIFQTKGCFHTEAWCLLLSYMHCVPMFLSFHHLDLFVTAWDTSHSAKHSMTIKPGYAGLQFVVNAKFSLKAVCCCKYNDHIAHGLNVAHVHITDGAHRESCSPKETLKSDSGNQSRC